MDWNVPVTPYGHNLLNLKVWRYNLVSLLGFEHSKKKYKNIMQLFFVTVFSCSVLQFTDFYDSLRFVFFIANWSTN